MARGRPRSSRRRRQTASGARAAQETVAPTPWVAPMGLARRTASRAVAAAVALAGAGCGSDGGLTPYTPAPMAFHALANVTMTAGATTVTLPLADQPASAVLQARTGGETVCTAALRVETALSDGTCKLSLSFGQRTDGPGLALTAAQLEARGAAGTCAPLQDRLPPGAEPVTYVLGQHTAWLPWTEPPAPDAGGLRVDKALVELRGTATLTAGSDTLTLGDRAVQLGGDLTGDVGSATACTPCAGPACKSPYPPYRLRETQPASTAHNLEFNLDRWLGQHLVVILTQGW